MPIEDQAPEVKKVAVKPSRHVVIAVAHMNKRRDALLDKQATIDKEIGELDAALLALKV